MRGGSRYGAGRPGWKSKVNTRCQLDVRKFIRDGFLAPGREYTWSWTTEGRQVASIGMLVDGGDCITLHYCANEKAVRLPIRLTRTECNYGGERVWFLCPHCGKRSAILYLTSGTFACRHCSKLAYASQSEDAISRLWRKQRKIERRLAGSAGEWNGWRKPKGMHQTTFDRLRAAIVEIEREKDRAFMMTVMQFFGQA